MVGLKLMNIAIGVTFRTSFVNDPTGTWRHDDAATFSNENTFSFPSLAFATYAETSVTG